MRGALDAMADHPVLTTFLVVAFIVFAEIVVDAVRRR